MDTFRGIISYSLPPPPEVERSGFAADNGCGGEKDWTARRAVQSQ